MSTKTDISRSESESTVHQEMFRSLLQTPHRQGDETLHLHLSQFHRDPAFYGKMAIWANQGNNSVRDINEIFVAVLFVSEFIEHREAAYVLLQQFPPYQVTRIMRYVTGYDEVVKHVSISKKPLPVNGSFGVTVSPAVYGSRSPKSGQPIPRKIVKMGKKLFRTMHSKGLVKSGQKEYFVDSYFVQHTCLGQRTVRGMLRKAIRSYLRFRERPENQGMIEGALIRAKNDLYGLYYRTNTLPGNDENSWINRYLFRHEIDEQSAITKRLVALSQLSKEQDPIKQAEIIIDYKLPYPQVVSVINHLTPTILVSLIEIMSPQELLNNLVSLKSRGAFDNDDVKALIKSKLQKIKHSKKTRLDALKGEQVSHILSTIDKDISQITSEISDVQLKNFKPISASTALLIDKSGSMEQAITMGKKVGSLVAQACLQKLYVFLFDVFPTKIEWTSQDGDMTTKSAWDRKLKMVRAANGTDPSTVVKAMIQSNISVEQMVIVTDEGENTVGKFTTQMKCYQKHFGFMPSIVIIRVGDKWGVSDRMEKSLKHAGIDVDVLDCTKTDQVSLPNLLPMLSRKSIFDLVLEVNEIKLPTKQDWDKSHNM